ncbi:MAG: type I-E CRISPR-associated protein Cas6/Cse3/CasE [Symbiobacteriia bacterium]
MYLSRLVLNLRDREVQHDLADCQSMHQRIMGAFPAVEGESARAELGVLYRADTDHRNGGVTLLVQSLVEPDWSKLPEHYLLGTAAQKYVTGHYRRIAAGSVLRFRLLANPTRRIDTKSGPNGEKRNGRRVELTREDDQLAWFDRKALDAGFRSLELRVVGKGPALDVTGRHPAGKVVLKGVVYEGRLVVKDQERFRHALEHGVGPGKAYGFGLLSVAP